MTEEENHTLGKPIAGLKGVIAADTEISTIDADSGTLVYHGYTIQDLAENAAFAEVAYLLWFGRLPGRNEYDLFLDKFNGSLELPIKTNMILRLFPKAATPMEVLRTAVSSLGHWDPESGVTRRDAVLRKAVRLTTRIPMIITAHARFRRGLEPIHPKPANSIAYNFLYTLSGEEPDPLAVKALDVAFVLHADHGFNASTFAARVTAATMSDIYSSVTSAIGALKGPLHGGANEQVMKMIERIKKPERAEKCVLDMLSRKEKVPGFGHPVYRTEDPRAPILKAYACRLSDACGDTNWLDICNEIHRVMRENTRVYPNVDFYSACLYHLMGIPRQLFTPMFVCSRVVGWTAHILEQWANNRILRPRSRYVGPTGLKYVPISERS